MKTRGLCSLILLVALFVSPLGAQDTADTSAKMEMPPMGAPDQMKELEFLIGDWDVASEWLNMEDQKTWESYSAVCNYKPIVDGCGLEMSYSGNMMGMPFQGYMIQSYDRVKKQWQAIWLDNMGGKMSFYFGDMKDGKLSLVGEESHQEQSFLSRMSTFNHTSTKFDWTMESSFDRGDTWILVGKAVYTKK